MGFLDHLALSPTVIFAYHAYLNDMAKTKYISYFFRNDNETDTDKEIWIQFAVP